MSAEPLGGDVGTNSALSTAERARFYLAWAIIVLGVAHVLATPYIVPGFTESALWFASGGGAFVLVGIFNLFAVVHGRSIPRLGQVSLVTNIVTTAFVVALVLATSSQDGKPRLGFADSTGDDGMPAASEGPTI